MTNEEREKLRHQLHEILDIVIETNGFECRQRAYTGTLPTMFFEYSGHVNKLDISMYEDGYDGSNRIYLYDAYIDSPIPEVTMERIRETCEKALTKKKESETLERDIEYKLQEMENTKAALKKMKATLKKLQKEGR